MTRSESERRGRLENLLTTAPTRRVPETHPIELPQRRKRSELHREGDGRTDGLVSTGEEDLLAVRSRGREGSGHQAEENEGGSHGEMDDEVGGGEVPGVEEAGLLLDGPEDRTKRWD
jgi:hypothetical protein